jgi:hypothetical protein
MTRHRLVRCGKSRPSGAIGDRGASRTGSAICTSGIAQQRHPAQKIQKRLRRLKFIPKRAKTYSIIGSL